MHDRAYTRGSWTRWREAATARRPPRLPDAEAAARPSARCPITPAAAARRRRLPREDEFFGAVREAPGQIGRCAGEKMTRARPDGCGRARRGGLEEGLLLEERCCAMRAYHCLLISPTIGLSLMLTHRLSIVLLTHRMLILFAHDLQDAHIFISWTAHRGLHC